MKKVSLTASDLSAFSFIFAWSDPSLSIVWKMYCFRAQRDACSTGLIYHSSGDSTSTYSSYPVKNDPNALSTEPSKVIKFCFGYDHMVLLKENGYIQSIARKNTMFNEAYETIVDMSLPIVDIAFGKKHALILTSKHEIIAFGDNSFGQCGIGKVSHESQSVSLGYITYFHRVNQKIVSIKCGAYHSAALSNSGDIYTWGSGKYGQLGNENLSRQILPRYVPIKIDRNDTIKQIACGPEATAAITKNGILYQWGVGQSTPVKISLSDEQEKVKKVSIGLSHTLCMTQCNKLYGYGLCLYGQLGVDAGENKQISTPLELKSFGQYEISDIECCGSYSVICTEKNGLFVIGYNDSLFNKVRHVQPFKIDFTMEKIVAFGCSRNDFALLAATSINKITPSIAFFDGSDIQISGHAFYKTKFWPTVRFEMNSSYVVQRATIKNTDDGVVLCANTPNWTDIKKNVSSTEPMTMNVSVSMDGKFYSDLFEMSLISAPKGNIFELSPKCGDIEGGFECYIECAEYISELQGLELNDIKIRIIRDEVYVIDAVVNESNQIQFVMPELQQEGEYKLCIAMDGNKFTQTTITFTAYKVECVECTPHQINLTEYLAENEEEQLLDFEIEVKGFAASNCDDYKMKFIASTGLIDQEAECNNKNDKTMFVTEYVYESQSYRNIAANGKKQKEEYETKRVQIEENQERELSELKDTYKSEDSEREKWVNKMEKDKKKKKKAADIEAFEAEVKKADNEWSEKLKKREANERGIKRKYKQEMVAINREESRIPKQNEQDNGDGFIKFKVDASKLKLWRQPNNILLQFTANGALYSDLCCIKTIDPKIKCIQPPLGLFSESTEVKVFFDGFDMQCIESKDLKISVEDTKDKIIEIETFKIEQGDDNNYFILMMLEKFTKFEEKKISIKYQDLFAIDGTFLAHDSVKVTSIEPNAFTINEAGTIKIKIETKYEISSKYVDECCVKITANDKSVLLNGKLNAADRKVIEIEFDEKCFEEIGTAKKAVVELSFNNQQWIKAKANITLK